MAGPLAHLRVLDLTDLRGALAGRLLGDLGADVLKVEPPHGDPGRLRPPFAGNVAGADRSLPFLFRNANKRGVVLDLHDAAGARRFAALCAEADVLLENFGPNRRQVLDLAPEAVRDRFPQLVHVIVADFGLSGPRAHWRAEPLAAFAGSGALYASGFPDRPPCWLPGFAAHDAAAAFAVLGALAALLARGADGRGQTVEVSVQEAAISGFNPWQIPLADYHRRYPMLPTAPPRNADGNYVVLPTADGYIRVLPAGQRHWRGLVELLGRADAFAGPEWDFALYRMINADAIRAVAAETLRDRTRAEVFAEAVARGVPLAPIYTPDEFAGCAHTRARGYFRRTGFPHLGEAPFAPAPFVFSRTPVAIRHPAPQPSDDHTAWKTPLRPHRADEPRGVDAAQRAASLPLAGHRAVIFGYAAVAPELGWQLAELGAEVIRIESQAHLDLLRTITIEPDAPNRAFTFNDASRGQRSVCLDMRQAHARELALALCAHADIVAENYRGGVLRGWGLDYEPVRRRRPDVIYLSSSGFGAGGPLAEAPSFGPLNASVAGVNWLWNFPDAPYPAGTSLNHPDHVASKLAAVAVLAALEHRRRTGEGQHIEMAQTEAAAFLIGDVYLEHACTGTAPRQQGNAVDDAVPHGVYPCAGDDRWCAIAVVGDAAWRRFERCLGWDAPTWASLEARRAARADIDGRVAEWTRSRDAEQVATTLQAAGVSACAVLGPDELRADPHLLARNAIVTVEHPEIGPERHIANPLRMSAMPIRPAPAALQSAGLSSIGGPLYNGLRMRGISAAVFALTLATSSAAPGQVCPGDCNGSGTVSIDELILAVDIALDLAGPERCRAADRDSSGIVSVDELIAAVDVALNGCTVVTPTPTVTPQADVCADVPSFPGVGVTTTRVTAGLDRPTTITAPPRDFSRVFVVEQRGNIRIIKDGLLLPDPFLSIPDRVSCCGERGLLGLAFPPDFATTGWFFVDYTDPNGNTVIARYQVSADPDRADRNSERVLIGIDQPFANHNGGQLAFGPDGYLYIGMGDGGSGGDPLGNAQNEDVLLGKLLRMNVRVPSDSTALYTVPPENPHADRGDRLGLIWAKGLRNPWRFGFDRATGDLYIADVGQGSREEIDVQPAASRGGENYGWRIFEGFACFNPAPASRCPDQPNGYTMPVIDYGHQAGRCSITGGYVYRGCALPDLRGQYFFSDYCTQFIQSFHLVDGVVTGLLDRTAELAPGNGQSIDQVSTFGEDGRGELYLADYLDGELYKIVPAPPAP